MAEDCCFLSEPPLSEPPLSEPPLREPPLREPPPRSGAFRRENARLWLR